MSIIHPSSSADNGSLLLEEIAHLLLSHQADDDRLNAAAARLYSLCSSITGIDEYSAHADDLDAIGLPGGEAIPPRDAARCVLDYRRTSKFLRGLYAAILEAQKRFPNTTIEVLYAGCGPFAPLAILLTTGFSSAEIKFTLLDVHKRSLNAAQRIFQVLGKSSFVRDYIQCDAASYQHNESHVIHVVVVEAMQAALEREPQVAITMNLAPQLCRGGIFLPERITIDCQLCDPTKEFPAHHTGTDTAYPLPPGRSDKARINLGPIFELTDRSCHSLPASGTNAEYRGPLLTPKLLLNVPENLDGEFNLMLQTTITVFDSIVLADYESGLTYPRILYDMGKMHGGETIEFAYCLSGRPGFKYRSLSGGRADALSAD